MSILAVGTKHSRAPPGLANGASALQRAGRGWHLENTPGPWAPPWDGERQSEPASRAVSLPALHWTVEAQGFLGGLDFSVTVCGETETEYMAFFGSFEV